MVVNGQRKFLCDIKVEAFKIGYGPESDMKCNATPCTIETPTPSKEKSPNHPKDPHKPKSPTNPNTNFTVSSGGATNNTYIHTYIVNLSELLCLIPILVGSSVATVCPPERDTALRTAVTTVTRVPL